MFWCDFILSKALQIKSMCVHLHRFELNQLQNQQTKKIDKVKNRECISRCVCVCQFKCAQYNELSQPALRKHSFKFVCLTIFGYRTQILWAFIAPLFCDCISHRHIAIYDLHVKVFCFCFCFFSSLSPISSSVYFSFPATMGWCSI